MINNNPCTEYMLIRKYANFINYMTWNCFVLFLKPGSIESCQQILDLKTCRTNSNDREVICHYNTRHKISIRHRVTRPHGIRITSGQRKCVPNAWWVNRTFLPPHPKPTPGTNCAQNCAGKYQPWSPKTTLSGITCCILSLAVCEPFA